MSVLYPSTSSYSSSNFHSNSKVPRSVLNTQLLKACYNRDAELVKYLLSQGANVNYICESHGVTPLMTACKRDDNDNVIQILLKNNSDISIRDSTGCTAMMWSCRADPSIAPSSLCDLSKKSIKNIQILYDYCQQNSDKYNFKDLISYQDETLYNALHWGIWDNCIYIVPFLLRFAPFLQNILSLTGTPLHLCIYRGNAYLSRLLCLNGCDTSLLSTKLEHTTRYTSIKTSNPDELQVNSACCMLYSDDIKRNKWNNSTSNMKLALLPSIPIWADNYVLSKSDTAITHFFPSVLSTIIKSYAHIYTECDEICDDFQTIIDAENKQIKQVYDEPEDRFHDLRYHFHMID